MKAPIGFVYPQDWQATAKMEAVAVEEATNKRISEWVKDDDFAFDQKVNMVIDKAESLVDLACQYKRERDSIKHDCEVIKEQNNKLFSNVDNLKMSLDFNSHLNRLLMFFLAISAFLNIVMLVSH